MEPRDISVGTSGWQFEDWAGRFYPLRVPKSKRLEYYSSRFDVGEINSTYYRIAGPATYEGIARKTPPAFRLFAKVHSDVTHARADPEMSLRHLTRALHPLSESGKLLGLLAQFPAAFHCSTENFEYLMRIRDWLAGQRLCVEFRNSTWRNVEVLSALRSSEIVWVSADEPEIAGLMPRTIDVTAEMVYLRLHGRNARAWYDHSQGDRYDYDYSAEEQVSIGKKVISADNAVRRGFVLFNNCYHGHAVANAAWLRQWFATIAQESAHRS